MSTPMPNLATDDQPITEFDLLADEYYERHKANTAITGEAPEYFAEYKIIDLVALVRGLGLASEQIFDFGSGIGNSVPCFRKHFGQSELTCADISARSIEIARTRFGAFEKYLLIEDEIPVPAQSQDIVFSACVFHHIPREQHRRWLAELLRITRPGGLLAIYEHNPLNPLTLHATSTCSLDANARLVSGPTLRRLALASGWGDVQVDYRLFFPSILKSLRPLEPHLGWLPLGAQYRIAALKK